VSELLQRVDKQIQNRRRLKRGGKILVAVSGGLDSVALLHLLHALAPKWRWRLVVAHFNHRLRGRSSDADEKLVRQAASAMNLPVVVESADVGRFAERSKLSIELAARKLRHEFFVRAAQKHGIRLVALAHHADDQVELFFLRLLRGTGGEGLAGMKWRSPSPVDSRVTLIRPLLHLTKAELREFARENKIRFRDDATNFSLNVLRNRIRNELLPLLRKKYQPALTSMVLRVMEIAGVEAEFAVAAARQWLKETGESSRPGQARTPRRGVPAFANLPVAIQRRVLQLRLAGLGVPADFALIEQLREVPGKSVSVSSNLSVARDEAGQVNLRSLVAPEFDASEQELKLSGKAGGADFGGIQLCWKFQRGISTGRGHRRAGSRGRSLGQTEFFDADKVGGRITVRHWRPGDRFRPIGAPSPVKLQDWFVNQKIPRARRHQLVVAAAESGEIFWIEGLRIGEHFKLVARTKRCLIWRWRRPK